MILAAKAFGINLEIIVIILLLLIIALGVMLFFTVRKLDYVCRKYEALMSGKKGKDLEKIIVTRFKEMDKVKANEKRLTREHKEIKNRMTLSICKTGLVKYDAFNDLAGKLSFSLALLNEENSGIVLNSMYSKEGCFTYAKEIIKGESYIALSDEEKEAIQKAMTVEEEIKKLTDLSEEELFDIND
jgi:hypothetical protein